MSITSLDGVVSGAKVPNGFHKVGTVMQAVGLWHSLFYADGTPGAAAAPSPGIAGAALTTYAGQLPFTNPSSGLTYLNRFVAAATATGSCTLLDRLWHNSGIDVTNTAAQTVNSAAWPARDSNASTNGEGVMVALEVSSVLGNITEVTTCTLSYTNQSGTAGRTATLASIPALAVAGTFLPFALASGDTGVRSIQSITLGTTLDSGTVHLVAYRKLTDAAQPVTNGGGGVDSLSAGFVRLIDNTVPFLVWRATGITAVTVTGQLAVTQG